MLFTRAKTDAALLLALCFLTPLRGFAAESGRATQAAAAPAFQALDALMERAVESGETPGAVLVVGHRGRVVYRKAYGWRALEPRREAMTVDTVFDVASLTKPVATATAVMRMVELGQVRLNDPVARYLPEFAANGKVEITLRMLLTHFSGLRPDLDLKTPWQGKQEALRRAFAEKPVAPPGARFLYSDINYLVLGALVERVSGMPLEAYADAHIFRPLGMESTRFLPPPAWRARTAPSDRDERGVLLRGVVHDPTARRMGGVAGHAGLFSTAADLGRFAQALLDGELLSPAMVRKMGTPQQPANATVLRGLGWDIDSAFGSPRGELLPVGSFGHSGFTGTSLWMDPPSGTYIVLLTNAVHGAGKNVVSLRSPVATVVAAALELKVSEQDAARLAAITGYNETLAGARRLAARNGQVQAGIDVLAAGNFAALGGSPVKKARVGVLTNQTGLDSQGRRTIDLLAKAPNVELAAIFSPEHGLAGKLDEEDIPDTRDEATGVAVYSLYRAGRRGKAPTELLRGLDAVVVDLQDAGVRFFSYEVMLGYLLESAAQAGVRVVVLDRPNPITGSFVQGPMSGVEARTLINYTALPLRHGLTLGELARLFNSERRIGAKLEVVAMQGWQRGDWYDSTGLEWVRPSPNLRSVAAATLYPGVALVEHTNVSVGRGTDTPFEVVGAPWVRARELAAYLNAREIPGVRFVPVSFTPAESAYKGERCQGVSLMVTDRNVLDAAELGLELAAALRALYPGEYKMDRMIELLGNQAAFERLREGWDPRRVAEEWREELEGFLEARKKYLLY